MDFFGQQERARKQTRLLLLYFAFSVLIAILMAYLVVGPVLLTWTEFAVHRSFAWKALLLPFDTVLNVAGRVLAAPLDYLRWLWRPMLFLQVASAMALVILAGSWWRIRTLSAGGSAVAALLGGRHIPLDTRQPDERKLRNVVEEMAIASSLPVPEVYILDRERGINAFAAGYTTSDTAIGVTAGAVKLLTRDELQGVIAHEFSHILHGDTRLNMRLMGIMHGLLWPVILGRIWLRGSNRAAIATESIFDERPFTFDLLLIPFGAALLAFGSVLLPLVRLSKSAICRQREWLADAAAVQFTRYPQGLGGALKKVGGLLKRGVLDAAEAETASHFYIVNCSYIHSSPGLPRTHRSRSGCSGSTPNSTVYSNT